LVGGAGGIGSNYCGSGEAISVYLIVDMISGKADGEVGGQLTLVGEDKSLLLGGYPMANGGSAASNLDDLDQVGDILQVAGIEPPETAGLVASKIIEKEGHGIDPPRVTEGGIPLGHGLHHIGEIVGTLPGVAFIAYGAGDFGQLAAHLAMFDGDRP